MAKISLERPKNNYLMQILKEILIIKIECDIVASPLDLKNTIDWYCKEYGYDEEDRKYIEIKYVDLKNEYMWEEVDDLDEEYEDLSLLWYINNVTELVRGNKQTPENNVKLIDGEILRCISFDTYCNKYLKSGRVMKQPEVIASSETF